jgi:hypothetical protein
MTVREINSRETDGLTVTGFWDPVSDTCIVAVQEGESKVLVLHSIPKDEFDQAFSHPCSYQDVQKGSAV